MVGRYWHTLFPEAIAELVGEPQPGGKTPGSLHPWLSMALYFPPIGSIGGVREGLIYKMACKK